MNIIQLIGKITQDVELRQVGEHVVTTLTLEVRRDFRNPDGNYDYDVIPITLWEGIALSAKEYCEKNLYVHVRGRIVQRKYEKDDKQYSFIEIIGEKVALLPNQYKGA